jgi:hypothetical protein
VEAGATCNGSFIKRIALKKTIKTQIHSSS